MPETRVVSALAAVVAAGIVGVLGCSGDDNTIVASDAQAADSTVDSGAPEASRDADAEANIADGGEGGDAVAAYCDTGAACDWPQWAHDPAHSGSTSVVGQPPKRVLAELVFDPFVAQEQAESGGDLLAHFQTPLLVGDDVYMVTKAGQYVSCDPPGSGQQADGGTACGPNTWNTQIWTEKHLLWENGALVETWTFTSDWTPEPASLVSWEPVFQPAVAGDSLYVPGAGGALWKIDRHTGAPSSHLQPFGAAVDPTTYVAGGLTVDAAGNVFYNALRLDPVDPSKDATGWLVKVTPGDVITTATYASLVPDAPTPTDLCNSHFTVEAGFDPPYPPPPDGGVQARPPQVPCLSQRPGVNVTPAIGADGTLFTASVAHGASRYAYVVAVNPDLTPKWDTSMRGRIDDGCGVLEPSMASPLPDGGVQGTGCRVGATLGVDPFTNEPPAPSVIDESSSTPVALPDGSVVYGAYTSYNEDRGHLMHFASDGTFLGSFDFGWDTTPAVYTHGGTYSIVIKDNHYFTWAGGLGPYGITRLDPTLKVEWSYLNTNTMSCARDPDGGLTCADDHPYSFEWCVNAPGIDALGRVYANSEDGNLYVLDPSGTKVSQVFLELALGAAYTPVGIDYQGRVHALNAGTLRVLGQ